MNIEKILTTDVLIIGGGAAGLRAAVAACDKGADTIVVLKGKIGRSGATVANWGTRRGGVAWQMADECSEEDSPDIHQDNILDAGLKMADPDLARILAYETEKHAADLESWGLRFIPDHKGQNLHYTGYSCFGNRPRAHGIANSGWGHAGDVVKVLVKQIKQRDIAVHENTFVTDLLVKEQKCVGALALRPDGDIVAYQAGAVVLGTGGARQMFPLEAGRQSIDTTGDGYAMALRAGAALTNMEFTQYMLHGLQPFSLQAPGIFWTLNPTVRNKYGENALLTYLPPGLTKEQVMHERTNHYPFSSRDASKWLDVSIASEIKAGRGTNQGALYLDFSDVNMSSFKPSRPQHLPQNDNLPVVLPEGYLQVRPAAHAINGGVIINAQAATTLPGLFAAAEAAAGPHGADRLGGGMLPNSQVFGARAGNYAAEYALRSGLFSLTPDIFELPLARLSRFESCANNAEEVLTALQQATGKHLMVTRNASSLEALLARIRELEQHWFPQVDTSNAQKLRRAVEVENSLCTAQLMALAALMRQESRGSHYREDFPEQDDENWSTNIIFRLVDGVLKQETGILGVK